MSWLALLTKSPAARLRILPECAALLDPNEDAARVKDLNTDLKCEAWLVQPVLVIWRDMAFAVRLCNEVTRGHVSSTKRGD
jgi:hypothetical protein